MNIKTLEGKIIEAYIFHKIKSPVEFVLKGINVDSNISNKIIQQLSQYSNLKFETISIIIYLLQTNTSRVKTASSEQDQNPFALELNKLLTCNKLTDDAVKAFVFNYANILQALQNIDFKEFYTGVYQQIDETIDKLEKDLPQKYRFIKRINKIELGNFFKAYNCLVNELNIEPTINDEIANIKLLVQYLKSPKGTLSAPKIKSSIEQLKQEHLNDYSIDFFDISEIEYLNYKILCLKQGGIIKPEFLKSLKHCFTLNNINKKGLGKFLYELFSIIHIEELLSYSQWIESIKDLPSPDNGKEWTHYRQRAINKLIQIEHIFN